MIGASWSTLVPNLTGRINKPYGLQAVASSRQPLFKNVKITVRHTSKIERYEGTFPSLSAFFLSQHPLVADTERLEEGGRGETADTSFFSVSYRTAEGHPSFLSLVGDTLSFRRGLSEMCFEKGKFTSFTYRTGYGELETEAFTDALSLKEKDGRWLLSLAYYARMGSMVQRNTMRFVFTPMA